MARSILKLLGISEKRLSIVQFAAFDGQQFIAQLMGFLDEIAPKPPRKRSRTRDSAVIQEIQV
jgi:hypothetical protein